MRVVVVGAAGHVGRHVVDVLQHSPQHTVVAAVVRTAVSLPYGITALTSLRDLDPGTFDVVIDFSTPPAVEQHARQWHVVRKPWVIGVTGIPDPVMKSVQALADYCPVLHAPNTSPAMAVMMMLVEACASSLNRGYDTEIRDLHRRAKRDAPSGTAIALGQALRRGQRKHVDAGTDFVCHSSRGGDVLGAHDVIFYGLGETLTLAHSVHDRAVYARGAVHAAQWLCDKNKPGLFGMGDVYRVSMPQGVGEVSA